MNVCVCVYAHALYECPKNRRKNIPFLRQSVQLAKRVIVYSESIKHVQFYYYDLLYYNITDRFQFRIQRMIVEYIFTLAKINRRCRRRRRLVE